MVFEGPVDNTSLIQVIAARLKGAKPLFEPMMACFIDAHMLHSVSMS